MGMVDVCFQEGCVARLKARMKDFVITDGWQLALLSKSGFITVLRMRDIAHATHSHTAQA